MKKLLLICVIMCASILLVLRNRTHSDSHVQSIADMPLSSVEYMIVLCRYESLVKTAWRNAEVPILATKTQFEVSTHEGQVRFLKIESADPLAKYTVYGVTGAIDGLYKYTIKEGAFDRVDFVAGKLMSSLPAPYNLVIHIGNYESL